MNRAFCTYFDSGYLPRGLALHASLRRHAPDMALWVLALDEACERFLRERGLPGMRVVTIAEIEAFDPEAAATRASRSRVEFYFTLTPVLPQWVLHAAPEVEQVTYLDADLYFFRSPQPIFDEIAGAPVAIIEHRFPPALQERLVYGRFNVGWVSFRRTSAGQACLQWWRDRCVEWCYDRLEPGRFADQKYLDQWPDMFDAHVIRHRGANVAPWNLVGSRVEACGSDLLIDGDRLVFFHFHGLTQLRSWLVDPNLEDYGARATWILRHRVFRPYALHLRSLAAGAELPARFVSPRSGVGVHERTTSGVSRVRKLAADLVTGRRMLLPTWRRR